MTKVIQGAIGTTHNKAMTEFTGFPFNSFCSVLEEELGANKDGIWLLNEGQTDDGKEFDRVIYTADIDFGISKDKRIRFIYIELFCEEDDTKLTVVVTNRQNVFSRDIICAAGMKKYRVAVSHKIFGTHLSFGFIANKTIRIDNVNVLVSTLSAGYNDMGAL